MFQRVYGEVDALTDAQARGTGQQQGGRREIANDTQLPIQVGIIFGGQGPRQTLIHDRNILAEKKSGRRGIRGGTSEIVEYTAETNDLVITGPLTNWRVALAKAAQPSEHVRITAQFRESLQVRKVHPQEKKPASCSTFVNTHRARAAGGSQPLQMGLYGSS